MLTFFAAALFLLGLVVGSFVNVVISRLGTGDSPLRGRSRCDHCGKILKWFELLPLVSFLVQKGRCRSCRKLISARHFWVELITAFLFAAIGLGVHNSLILFPYLEGGVLSYGGRYLEAAISFVYFAFFAAEAVAISCFDMEKRIIPWKMVAPLLGFGFLANLAGAVLTGNYSLFGATLAAAFLSFFFFWAIWFLSRGRAMGRGDADAALAISFYLKPLSALAGFVMAFWIGAIAGLAMLALGRFGWKSQIPFAPFLFAGAITALFLPPDLFYLFAF